MSISNDYSYCPGTISEFCKTAGPIMCKLKPGCLTTASLKYAAGGDNWIYKTSSKIFTTNIRTPNFEQAGRPSCSPTNSVRRLKAKSITFHGLAITTFYAAETPTGRATGEYKSHQQIPETVLGDLRGPGLTRYNLQKE